MTSFVYGTYTKEKAKEKIMQRRIQKRLQVVKMRNGKGGNDEPNHRYGYGY
jgi:hypothetical protein